MYDTSTRRLTFTVGLALAVAALTGCTGSGAPTSSSTAQSENEQQEFERWFADYRTCLSAQGFEMTEKGDLDPGSREAELDLAVDQCTDELGDPPGLDAEMTPEEKAADREGLAAEKACYAAEGITGSYLSEDPNVPEPVGASDELVDSCFEAYEKAWQAALDR